VFLLSRAPTHALDARPDMNRTSRTPTSRANTVEDRTRSSAPRRSGLARWLADAPGLAKVPEVTVGFWVAKALSTALGESTSDFLVHRIGPPAAVVISGLALIAGLAWQLSVDRYIARVYWFAVVMVAISGTLAADAVHVGLGVPYAVSTVLYAIVLAVVFALWQRTEGTLSIHSIRTHRRELFYWAAVLATFALGTAAGDMTATTFGWGYLASGLVFAGVVAIPAILYWRTRLNRIFLFWFAYVFTRPLGASFADWLGKDRHLRGLGLGDGPVSLVLAAVIVCVVIYVARTGLDVQAEAAVTASRR
jgi:uncharacterized membrane-anchored protein